MRRNVDTLSVPQLDALRAGIALMQSRAETDPRSWLYQANIHGSTQGAAETAWNSCQHGSWYFLAWHRMYLYYMEKILRAAVQEATNDPTAEFALPYWDYSSPTNPNARQIPEPYRQPADPSNTLFVADRSPAMNAGGSLPASSVLLTALDARDFSSPAGSNQSFGGQRSGPGHSLGPHSLFENTPHDVIHVNVGGGMASFEFAARDPVFWLHHANIDRLWERWLSLGDGRANPSGAQGEPWLTQTFEFFDEDAGAFVTLSGSEILDTVDQLEYAYDDLGGSAVEESEPPQPQPEEEGEAVQSITLAEEDAGDVAITDEPVTFELEVAEEEAEEAPGALTLRLEDVSIEAVPEGHYEVHANAPEGETPDHTSESYVGNMAFFGVAPSETSEFQYSLADVEQRLRDAGEWDGTVRVTLIKTGPEPPPGVAVEEAESPVVRIGTLRLTRE